MRVRLAASILAADLARLGAHAREAVEAGADWLHVDVMDGHFVPAITMGPRFVEALQPLRAETGAWIDVHLMVERPERFLADFIEAGADVITFHVEACSQLERAVHDIQTRGAKAGVTLNPATPLAAIEPILSQVDVALVMSVNPGAAGQSYIPGSTEKVQRLRRLIDGMGSQALLEVDGGIKPENAGEVVGAGADVLVAATAIFGGHRPVRENVAALRQAAGARHPQRTST